MLKKIIQDLIDQKVLLLKKLIQQELKDRYEARDPQVGLLG